MTAETLHWRDPDNDIPENDLNLIEQEPFADSDSMMSTLKNSFPMESPVVDPQEIDHLLQTGELSSDDVLDAYLREVSKIPLLSKEEELRLAKTIERGRFAEQLAKADFPKGMENRLNQIQEDGIEAREQLTKANVRLVISVAKTYRRRGVHFLELIQEGNLGLMNAVEDFDYHRGVRFATYATWCIRTKLRLAIGNQAHTIRIPVHVGDSINKLLHTQHQLTQRLGHTPSHGELAGALEIPEKRVEELIQVVRMQPSSLNTPIGDEEDSELGDFIPDDNPLPPEQVHDKIVRESLIEALACIPPREALILRLRFGLDDGQPLTLDEVGRRMGVTRERVRQIETQAIGRLRHPSIRRKIQDAAT